MQSVKLSLPNLLLLQPTVFKDHRGYFCEMFQKDRYKELGIDVDFVQDNHSYSKKNILRGMHFQNKPGQAKLVTVVHGKIFDVAVDIRPSSKTYGQYVSVILDDQKHEQFYIPSGFAHGFCVLSDTAHVVYKVSNYFDAKQERGFRWDDPDIAIDWPCKEPILSQKDQNSPLLHELFQKEETFS